MAQYSLSFGPVMARLYDMGTQVATAVPPEVHDRLAEHGRSQMGGSGAAHQLCAWGEGRHRYLHRRGEVVGVVETTVGVHRRVSRQACTPPGTAGSAQGWTDAIRHLHPDETIYTFWDYFRNAYGRNAGLRIDHFLLSPGLAKKLISAGVNKEVRGWEKSSDHAPVWIELK